MPGTDATITANVRDLYSDHHNWLQRWLGGKLGCSDRAADLMHDTFLRLLTRGEYTPLKQPRAYLQTIAKRVLMITGAANTLKKPIWKPWQTGPTNTLPDRKRSTCCWKP